MLLKCAGANATQAFDEVHAPDMLQELPKDKFIGFLDENAVIAIKEATEISPPPTVSVQAEVDSLPPLETILSANDFTQLAQKTLTPKTWAFYSSAATDLVTHTKNKELVRRIMIRPRILRDVSTVKFERRILGFQSTAPFFISPTAMARLAHPDGELAVSRAAGREGIIQCVSLAISCTCPNSDLC